MPYNVDFELPLEQVQLRRVYSAPAGSLIFPIMGAASLVCAVRGQPETFFVDLTTYGAFFMDKIVSGGDLGLIWLRPEIKLDLATICPVDDEPAWSAGDLITDGKSIAIIALNSDGKLVRCLLREMEGPFLSRAALFKGWHLEVEGQRMFSKLP